MENKKVTNVSRIQIGGLTVLDSLQGKWINDKDSTSSFEIIGRDIFKNALTEDSLIENIHLKLYFTNFPFRSDDENKLPIDITLRKGKYLVFVNQQDNNSDCYEINGFYKDSAIQTFSFQPFGLFRMSSVLSFRKVF